MTAIERRGPNASLAEFEAIFESVKNWGRWGLDDVMGTLNYITPDHVRRAASLVRTGRSISLAIPINNTAGPDNPNPAVHPDGLEVQAVAHQQGAGQIPVAARRSDLLGNLRPVRRAAGRPGLQLFGHDIGAELALHERQQRRGVEHAGHTRSSWAAAARRSASCLAIAAVPICLIDLAVSAAAWTRRVGGGRRSRPAAGWWKRRA